MAARRTLHFTLVPAPSDAPAFARAAGGSYSVYAGKDIDMVPGPGMDCSICVWVFVMLILPINCLVKPTDAPSSRANPSTAAQYMSREAQPTVVDGPAVQGGDHGLQV